jgi:hypothetical protein
MLQKVLGGVGLLIVTLGCRDGPMDPANIRDPTSPASSDALTAINDLQNDPLVALLVREMPESDAARELRAIFLAASRGADSGKGLVTNGIWPAPDGGAPPATHADLEIYSAALAVILDEVRAILAARSE